MHHADDVSFFVGPLVPTATPFPAETASDAHCLKNGFGRHAADDILKLLTNVFHQRTHPLSTCGIIP